MPLRLPDALNPRRNLRARFALALGGSGLAFALLSTAAVGVYQRRALVDTLGQAMRREAQLVAHTLEAALHDRVDQLAQLAAQPLPASGLIEPGDLRLLLEAQRSRLPELVWLAATDEHGRVLVATGTLGEGEDLSAEPWFRRGLAGPWVGGRRPAGHLAEHLGVAADGQPPQLVDLATPLLDFDGRRIGVLVARMRWDWLDQLHRGLQSEQRRLPGSDSLVLDGEGGLLLGPRALLAGPLALPAGLVASAALPPGTADAGRRPVPRVLDWADGQRYLTVQTRDDLPGAARPVPHGQLTVVLRQPVALAFAPADELQRRLLSAGLLATAGFIALSIWLAGRISRPVRALSAAARRVERGEAPDFAAITPQRRDEVAELAGSLQVLHQVLAQRLAEQQRASTRFQTLFEGAPIPLYISVDGRLSLPNRACLALFGASEPAQLLGRHIHQLVPASEHALLDRRIVEMRALHARGATPPLVEHRIQRLDGTLRDVEITALPITLDEHAAVQVMMIDVTEAKRDRLLLARTSRMAQVGGWTLELASGRVSWTDELARMYEADPGASADWPLVLSTLEPADRQRVQDAVDALARGGEPVELELRMRAPSGRRRWVRVQAHALRQDGRTVGIAGVTQDVTERREAEEAVRELNARLEQRVAERTAQLAAANAELDSFAYAVSHDLRAPLRAMSGFSQALLEDHAPALDADAREYLDQIIQASHRMGDLIDGLLLLSRSSRGALRRDEVDLSALAERVMAELRRAEPQRRVQADIAPGLRALGDVRMLDAVLHNLLGNAWKYTRDRADARIALRTEDHDGQRWFCVEDNGAGFDMAHAGRLFKAFARLHRQDEFPGLGIGLATVQRIIQRHGGQIVAEGLPGDGARFRFTLPAPGTPSADPDLP